MVSCMTIKDMSLIKRLNLLSDSIYASINSMLACTLNWHLPSSQLTMTARTSGRIIYGACLINIAASLYCKSDFAV